VTATLTLDEILLRLSTEQGVSEDTEQLSFPAEALLAAKSHWAEFWPHIAVLMQRMQADEELADDEYQLLFYGVMLLADVADVNQTSAFIQWVDTTDGLGSDLEYTMGDAMTEDLATMLFILSGGQQAPLQQLLVSEKAGIYVKSAALTALFAQLELVQQQGNAIDNADLTAFLQQVISVAARHGQKFVLAEIAIWCITFGLQHFKATFEVLLRQNKVDTASITSREIRRWQLANCTKPLASGLVRTSFDVMSLQHWLAFQPDQQTELQPESPEAAESLFTAMHAENAASAIMPKVLAGRNDACPCGSGKKYKKCCLN
jgi:hypothetical protein